MLLFWILFLAAAGGSVYCRYNNRRFYKFAKPAPLLLLMSLYLAHASGSYLYWLFVLGLAFGMVGDILLLRESTFRYGAVFFSLGHVLYIVAFFLVGGWPPISIALLILGYTTIFCGLLFRRMTSQGGVGSVWMGLPYLVMVSLLLIFASGTVGHIAHLHAAPAIFAGLDACLMEALFFSGALLFYVSDFVLVWNRYAGSFRAGQFVILTTYYAAQALIAAGALSHLL